LAGVFSAGSAFVIWGSSPLFWKKLHAVAALEIIAHRIVWSFLFLALLLAVQGRWPELRRAMSRRRTLPPLLLSTVFIAVNWLVFVWAVNHGYVLQASLGYYITPLVNISLGMVFLRERLRPLQKWAVALAACGVLFLTLHYGAFPWVSLCLAFSFGLYGLIRKVVDVGSVVGLSVETLLLSLAALPYLIYLDRLGTGAFVRTGLRMDLLLVATTVFTALPLVLFTLGARRIHLSTVGFLQYIAPSCFFLLAVFVFHEPVSRAQILTFLLIWTALGLYSTDSVLHYRRFS